MSGGVVRVVLAAAFLLVAGSGCSDGGVSPLPAGPAAPSPTPSASATESGSTGSGLPTTTVAIKPAGRPTAVDRAVLAGYQRFWEALGPAYTTGDLAALRAATVEPATSRYTKVARELRAKDRTLRGPVLLAPLVVGRSTTLVTVVDCADLRNFRTYDRSGKALFPMDKGLTTAEVRLRKVGTAWRVSSVVERQTGCRQQGG